jgi:hypothetical protein
MNDGRRIHRTASDVVGHGQNGPLASSAVPSSAPGQNESEQLADRSTSRASKPTRKLNLGPLVARSAEAVAGKTTLLVVAAILIMGGLLFRGHLGGRGILLGNADRLHSFLNMRLFEIDSWRLGWVPTWNEAFLLGFAPLTLHYMQPGIDPLALPLLLVSREHAFWAAGLVMVALWIAGTWVSYRFIRVSCNSALFGLVGGLLFTMSPIVMQRLLQVDTNFVLFILTVASMHTLRRSHDAPGSRSTLILALMLASIIVWTFLQEAAYVLLLIGLYGLYRGLVTRSMRPVLITVLAMVIAGIAGMPRVITVFGEVRGYDRPSTLLVTNPNEFARWFAEGIYGRYPSEVFALGNSINLVEGLQLHVSIVGTIVLLLGVLRYRGLLASMSTAMLVGVAAWILNEAAALGPLPADHATRGISALVLVLVAVHLLSAYRYWARHRTLRAVEQGSDVPFHILVLAGVLASVLIEPVQYLVYQAFMQLDFTHARISIVAAISSCVLISTFLADWAGDWGSGLVPRRRVRVVLAALGLGVGLVLLTNLVGFGLRDLAPRRLFGSWILQSEAMRVVATALAVVGALGLTALLRRTVFSSQSARLRFGITSAARSSLSPWLQSLPILVLGFAATFQAFEHMSLVLNGAQARTYPAPFGANNFFLAPPGLPRPPTEEQIDQLHARLQSDRYRTALVPDLGRFPVYGWPLEPAYAAHIAPFWRLRVVEGYGPGVQDRLAQLPWPQGTRTLRTLSFPTTAHLPWPLLAVLNVRYVVPVSAELYYGVPPQTTDAWLDRLELIENPLPVAPREFFAASVRPLRSRVPPERIPPLSAPPSGLEASVWENGLISLNWRDVGGGAWYDVQWTLSESPTQTWTRTTGRSAVQIRLPGLPPDTDVTIRVRACETHYCSPFSPDLRIRTATPGLHPPAEVQAQALESTAIQLSWQDAQRDMTYLIERRQGDEFIWRTVAQAENDTRTVVFRDLAPLTTASFRLRACQGTSCSPHSDVAAAATPSTLNAAELLGAVPADVTRESVVEGRSRDASFSTDGTIRASYSGGLITLELSPSAEPRFLVLNERYSPSWRAWIDGVPTRIYPTNIVMRGVEVPPGATQVRFVYTPFLLSRGAIPFYVSSLALLAGAILLFRRGERASSRARRRENALVAVEPVGMRDRA